MKRIVFLLIITCLSVVNLSGQTETGKKNLIETHIAFGKGNYGHRESLLGAGGLDNKYYYTLGIDYSRELFKRFDLCSGMEYTYHNMMFIIYGSESKEYLKLVTIPVQFKYHLGKLVYFNGGLFLNVLARTLSGWFDYETFRFNHSDRSLLLGCGLGIGLEHEFYSGVVLSLNPYARWNGIGKPPPYPRPHQFLQGGVSFGIGKKF